MQLKDYKRYRYPKYLDGRYFNLVLRDYPGLVEAPLIFNIRGSDDQYVVTDNRKDLSWRPSPEYLTLIRMVIEIDISAASPAVLSADFCLAPNSSLASSTPGERTLPPGYNFHMGLGTLASRHSNLIVLDHNKKQVIRFDPLSSPPIPDVNDHINTLLDSFFPEYDLVVSPISPQELSGDFYCNAYVTKAAYNVSIGADIDIAATPSMESKDDIEHFAEAVVYLYGPLAGTPDLEFGPGGGLLGAVGGGLLGAGVGGALGGPAGAVGGAFLGGLGGYAVGSSLTGGPDGSSRSSSGGYRR